MSAAVDALLRQTWLFDIAFLTLALVHLIVAPYTKVEESFSVQATHDLIYTTTLDSFDHLTFPGVVPRSFIGPLTLTTLAYPLIATLQWLAVYERLTGLLLVRAVLGALYALTFSWMRREAAALFDDIRLAALMAVLACCQFHVPFYCTRLLPNVFAAVAVNAALACYIRALRYPATTAAAVNASMYTVATFALACIVFRCDMLLLALPCILTLLITRRLPLTHLIFAGVVASLSSIAATVLIDSYYWQRWLWPELAVLLYNNPVEGQYSAWGVSPWHYYFTSALPRALLATALLVPLGLLHRPYRLSLRQHIDWRAVWLAAPAVAFVCVYSLLAHKELRFILPAVPLFTAVAAVGLLNIVRLLQTATTNQHKKTDTTLTTSICSSSTITVDTYAAAALLSLCSVVLVMSFFFSSFSLYASAHNYPGGTAFHHFHSLLPASLPSSTTSVHLSNLACTSGVSRWGEQRRGEVSYDKREGVSVDELGLQGWEWLVEEVEAVDGYEVVAEVEALQRVDWRRLRLVLEPKLWILKKRDVGG